MGIREEASFLSSYIEYYREYFFDSEKVRVMQSITKFFCVPL